MSTKEEKEFDSKDLALGFIEGVRYGCSAYSRGSPARITCNGYEYRDGKWVVEMEWENGNDGD